MESRLFVLQATEQVENDIVYFRGKVSGRAMQMRIQMKSCERNFDFLHGNSDEIRLKFLYGELEPRRDSSEILNEAGGVSMQERG